MKDHYTQREWASPLEQEINSYLMEVAAEHADTFVHNDMKDNEIYITTLEGSTYYTDEAQELFNEYYDAELDGLYTIINNVKEIEERYKH